MQFAATGKGELRDFQQHNVKEAYGDGSYIFTEKNMALRRNTLTRETNKNKASPALTSWACFVLNRICIEKVLSKYVQK